MSFSILSTLQNNHRSALSRQQAATRVLATGKRINSYADDPAGAAIASRMNVRAAGLEMARRNVADALSMATMTDAGLGEVSTMLSRIRELSVRASNGTYSNEDRSLMQMELESTINEINRFASSYKWNGTAVIGGTKEGLNGTRYDTYFNDNMANLGGAPINANIELDTLNPSLSGPENTTATWVYSGFFVPDQSGVWEFRTTSDDASYLWIGADALLADTSNNVGNALVSNPGLHGMLTSTPGATTLVAGTEYPIKAVVGNNQGPMGFNLEYRFGSSGNFVNDIGLMKTANHDVTVQAGEDVHDAVDLEITGLALASSLQLTGLSIEKADSAQAVIAVIDRAIHNISTQRAAVGASVNRLISQQSSIISEQTSMRETASGIEDADFAEASTEQAVAQLVSESGLKAIKVALNMNRTRILDLLKV